MRNITWLGSCAAVVALGVSGTASAFPTEPSVEVNQRGGFLMIGNSQGYDCSLVNTSDSEVEVPPIPFLEGMEACDDTFGGEASRLESPGATDTALDLFWTMEGGEPFAQQVDPTMAVSGAVLTIPEGAEVTHARLYWAGYLPAEDAADPAADPSVEVTFPTSNGAGSVKVIEADWTWTQPNEEFYWYQSGADVTSAVQAHGSGLHLVTDLATSPEAQEANDDLVAAWWLAVIYEDLAADVVNLRLYDGLDVIGTNETADAPPTVSVPLSGLPARGTNASLARLGVVGYEGDARLGGDYVRIGQTAVSNSLNPAENFFNGTRSLLGQTDTNEGDFPFLPGTPRSVSGLDIDVLDVSEFITAGSELPTIHAGSYFERYLLAALVTEVPVSIPLINATMTVDHDGSGFEPGSVVQYTVVIENSGSAAATGLTYTNILPEQLDLLADSVQSSGAGSSVTANQVVFNETTGTLTVRIGEGAGANAGGTLEAGASLELHFEATIIESLPGCATNPCEISNQGVVQITGSNPDESTDFPTDGEPSTPALEPTVFEVAVGCISDDECPESMPLCRENTCVACEEHGDCSGEAPYCVELTCVECRDDADCTSAGAPTCNPDTNACECANDAGCGDTDGDGLPDDLETDLGTDPEDADTDDDGLLDGDEPNPEGDTDGDGLIDALDVDSDNDGLLDGTEAGTDCSHEDTDPDAGACVPDEDGGDTTTDPGKADTDGGGLQDGAEDFNLDGAIDNKETDPNNPDDDTDLDDRDGDGLSDDLETVLRSDPNDADTDDDGVLDGDEPNPGRDDDGDGRTSLTDADSDNDGLFDGTELGLDCSHEDTDPDAHSCVPDADEGDTTTSPIDPDTDDGGISDGSEDFNLNGRIDDGEGDPNDPSDDSDIVDSDGDGLSDGIEDQLGSDPNDADTDDDGVLDGDEANPSQDLDGDGLYAASDPDSDGDLLYDGVEVGTDCSHPDSDPRICIVDADAGLTTSSPLWVDSDADGVADGVADANWDGTIDETDELFLDGEIKGGGCACSTPQRDRGSPAGLLLGLAAAALAAARRRRR